MKSNKGSFFFQHNTSIITLTTQHDILSMTKLLRTNIKNMNYFIYFPNTAMHHVQVMLRKISNKVVFFNYKRN